MEKTGGNPWSLMSIHILSKPSQSSSFPSFHMQPKSSDSFQTLVASNQLNSPISQSLTCKHSGPFEITMFGNCTRLPLQLGNLLGASTHICILQSKEVELTLAMLMNFSKMFFGPPQLLTEQNSANTTETIATEPSPEEVDAKFDKLSTQVVSPVDGDGLAASVPVSEVYDLTTLDDIQAGRAGASNVDDELELISRTSAPDSWDPASLLLSLGV